MRRLAFRQSPVRERCDMDGRPPAKFLEKRPLGGIDAARTERVDFTDKDSNRGILGSGRFGLHCLRSIMSQKFRQSLPLEGFRHGLDRSERPNR